MYVPPGKTPRGRILLATPCADWRSAQHFARVNRQQSVQPSNAEPRNHSEVYRDEYIAVFADLSGKLVRLQRSNLPHPTPADFERSFRQAAVAVDRIGRTDRVMLIDVREALGRNEPEFDAAMRRIRPIVEAKMLRVAVLLRSSAGLLQMKRINQEDGVWRMLTMNEQEALDFLLE